MNRKGVKLLICFALVLLVIPMASALAPVAQVPVDPGIEITYPQYSAVQSNQSFNLSIHVANSTNLLRDGQIDCHLALFSPTGNQDCHSKLAQSDDALYIDITIGNFSELGSHAYTIFCNSSYEIGFASGVFYVTPNGLEPSPETRQAATENALFFFFLTSLVLFALSFLKINKIAKWSFIAFSLIFFLVSVNVLSVSIADEVANAKLVSLFDFLAASSFYLGWFLGGCILIFWIISVIFGVAEKNKLIKGAKYDPFGGGKNEQNE